jgi:hypothetical protein
LPSVLDTTTVNLALLGDLHNHGFEDGKKCELAIYLNPQERPPLVRFRNDPVKPLELEAALWISLHCEKKNALDGEYLM